MLPVKMKEIQGAVKFGCRVPGQWPLFLLRIAFANGEGIRCLEDYPASKASLSRGDDVYNW